MFESKAFLNPGFNYTSTSALLPHTFCVLTRECDYKFEIIALFAKHGYRRCGFIQIGKNKVVTYLSGSIGGSDGFVLDRGPSLSGSGVSAGMLIRTSFKVAAMQISTRDANGVQFSMTSFRTGDGYVVL